MFNILYCVGCNIPYKFSVSSDTEVKYNLVHLSESEIDYSIFRTPESDSGNKKLLK